MNKVKEEGILEAFLKIAPILPMFFDEPVSIAITDKVNFIYNQACNEIPIKSALNQPFPKESTANTVLTTGKSIIKEIPQEIYGIPFKSYAVPLKEEDGTVVGCVLLAKSIQIRNSVKSAIEELADELEEVSTHSQLIVEDVQISAKNMQLISEFTEEMAQKANKMNDILQMIHKISNVTKILGLNASIEAGRVGEKGRGFTIVAREIEKMSSSTTDSAKIIGDIVDEIKENLQNINTEVTETIDKFSGQVYSLEKISTTIQDLNKNVKVIDQYMKQL